MNQDDADTLPVGGRSSMISPGGILADRYRLHAILGEGGMGTVFRAEDLHLDEQVALKVLHTRVANIEGVVDRFKREVKLARRVTHENVARVYELGRDREIHFLTMELIDGEPLSLSLRGHRRFDPKIAGPIIRGIAAGLEAAHAASVVHRDIKPDNVMIASRGRVVITDFGIARQVAALSETAGGLVGTPAYMAPEQIEGGDLTARTDLFSFGVLIFQMLTGRLPWGGDTPFATAFARLQAPAPDPRTLAPDLDPAIAAMVLRCLERAPGRRPANASEIAAVFIAGGATDIRPLAKTQALPQERTRIAVLPFAGEEKVAGLLTQDAIDALSQVRALRVLSRRMAEKAGDRSASEVAAMLSVDRIVEGSVRSIETGYRVVVRLIDGTSGEQIHTERIDASREAIVSLGDQLAARLAEAMNQAPPPMVQFTELSAEAFDLYLEARHHYRGFTPVHAITLLTRAEAMMPDHPLILSALVVARVRHLFIARQPNLKDLEWVRDAAMRAVQAAPDLSEPRVALAMTRLHVGDVVGAVVALREALARSPSNAEALGWLGEILIEVGRSDEGVRRLELALSLDDSLTTPRWSLARYRAYQGDFAGALSAVKDLFQRTRDPRLATASARLMLWQRDLEGVRSFGEKIAAQAGDDSIFTLYPVKAILGEEALELAVDRVDRLLRQPGVSWRTVMLASQSMTEVCAFLDRTDLAMSGIARAADHGLTDLLWADRCPLLESARRRPEWPSLRARIAAHAEAVIDAVW